MIGLLFLFFLFGVSGHDLQNKSYCSSRDFRLDCNRTMVLAIHGAVFTNDPLEANRSCCDAITNGVQVCSEDIRTSLNNRCSGMAHCHYNLTEDYPQRKCLGEGVITLAYACVTDDHISSYCNTKVKGPWGYIMSPGYPQFYPNVSHCLWTIESSEGHELILTILDLSIRPRKMSSTGIDMCLSDSLTILEGHYKLRRHCGAADDETRKPLLTGGNEITVKFSTEKFSPARGFLLFYRFHGCPTIPAPEFGYMVYRNRTTAIYMCCRGHYYSDTMERIRVLHCIDDFRWNVSIGTCLTLEEITTFKINSSLGTIDDGNQTEPSGVVGVYLTNPTNIEDILIPAASIVIFIFGTVAVVLCIIRRRKKRKASTVNQGLHHMPRHRSVCDSVPRAPQVLMTDL